MSNKPRTYIKEYRQKALQFALNLPSILKWEKGVFRYFLRPTFSKSVDEKSPSTGYKSGMENLYKQWRYHMILWGGGQIPDIFSFRKNSGTTKRRIPRGIMFSHGHSEGCEANRRNPGVEGIESETF